MSQNKNTKPQAAENIKRVPYESAYRMPRKSEDTPLSVFRLKGALKPGNTTQFSVDGEDFELSNETWVIGDLTYGAAVQVKGVFKPGRGRIATKVTVVAY